MSDRKVSRSTFAQIGGVAPLALLAVSPADAAGSMSAGKVHKVAFQVSENSPAAMNLTLNNVVNLTQFYSESGDSWKIEVVAYGPGLHMFRADDSPVKARLTSIKQSIPDVIFSACDNTLKGMEKAEGRAIALVPESRIVPAGVVRLAELQEQGYSYIKA
jgi:intracellular sulfur oxidation DsrE/DsrF family protein